MSLIRNTVPELAPLPINWGTYAADSDIHFYLCSFHDMTGEIPVAQPLAALIAKLHKEGLSPNGKYGFVVSTYQSKWPQPVEWKESWEEFFLLSLQWILGKEEESQGQNAELSRLKGALFEKVVPRLLRPLETGGNQIEPRLVHGDLWDGNCSTDVATLLPIIFDATSIYAHNEYELAPCVRRDTRLGSPISRPTPDVSPNLLLRTILTIDSRCTASASTRSPPLCIREIYVSGISSWTT